MILRNAQSDPEKLFRKRKDTKNQEKETERTKSWYSQIANSKLLFFRTVIMIRLLNIY